MIFSFDDIEHAFLFVSMSSDEMNDAYLCRETGQIFYDSEMVDSDELPDDIDDPEKYVSIPHKNDLDLGKSLVLEFTSTYLPEYFEKVHSFFHHKGAYSKYKTLLERKGLLDDWYKFEDNREKMALKDWCTENNILIKD